MAIFGDSLRFGIHSGPQNTSFSEYRRLWERAEALGLDWASVFDHFMPIQSDPGGSCFEGLTLLSAMAAVTSRLRCGVIVTGVTYRHPAVLANMAVTIDHVSNGRLELGMGAAWYETEHQQYGMEFPPIATRAAMLDEAVQIVRSLWSETITTFDGRFWRLKDAHCEPKPLQVPSIPLWIGGTGERRTIPIVARWADGWNVLWCDLETFRHKLDVLANNCRALGRDPDDIRKALIVPAVIGETDKEAAEALAARAAQLHIAPEQLSQAVMVLSSEQLAERLVHYRDLGIHDFLLMARPPMDEISLQNWAQQVAPDLRAA